MDELKLIKSEAFGQVQCDFWQNEHGEILMTREQIGRALEYKNSREQIKTIHSRYKDRLDKFSRRVQIDTPLGGEQETTVYSSKGVYEICRWSRQPKADTFMDWVWDVIEGMRKGDLKITPRSKTRELEAEAKLINAKARQAKVLFDAAKGLNGVASRDTIERLASVATEVLTWKPAQLMIHSDTYEEKLRKQISKRLDEEFGHMSRQLTQSVMRDYKKDYERGTMREDVYFAFRSELEKRLLN